MNLKPDTTQAQCRQSQQWDALNTELDEWSGAGLTATFWWRDDDAIKQGPKLEYLINQSIVANSPLLLAVIPANVDPDLLSAVTKHEHVLIAQHGYAHINHAPRGQGLGAWELGMHRGEQAVMNDLIEGYEILSSLFNNKFVPVVVPPWNKIDSALFKAMSINGYKGVSAFGLRECAEPVTGLIQINCHCDPIKWKGGARFAGDEKALNMIIEHLVARRTGKHSLTEPTGLLTHHIDMDDLAWQFVAGLAEQIKNHPAACWCDPRLLFNINQ